jgi:hypothetical protein
VDRSTAILLFGCDASLRTCRKYGMHAVRVAFERLWLAEGGMNSGGNSVQVLRLSLSYLPFDICERAQPVKPGHRLTSRGSEVDPGA